MLDYRLLFIIQHQYNYIFWRLCMDFVKTYCENCSTETVHDVIDTKGSDDCWFIMVIQCSECGKEREVKVYS